MKLSKSSVTLLALAGLLSFSPLSQAQNTNATRGIGQAMRGGVDAQMNRLSKELSLTDDQKPKVKAMIEEQNKKLMELRGDSALSQEDRRTKMKTIREESNTKMKEILTAEQFQKYETFQQQQRNRRPGGPGATGSEGATSKPKE
ncbi:MAG: hypothetical protein ACTHLW_19945 [Verrucomicrobiota bacterium]